VQLSIKELMDRFQGSVSGQRAWQTVVDLTRYHRIQASPGYRAAAQYMLERLQAAGVDARIHSYAADGKTVFWTSSLSEEWMAEEATLDLLLPGEPPERLADFRACPILIQRSASFEGEAEVVAVEKGERPEAYEGLDVAGKVVLTDGDVQQVYEQAVVRRGAVGILFDSMRTLPPVRERIDLPDGRHYTSFWWGPEDETKCFGFVLTPRQGDSLRRRLREPDAHGDGESEPVRVRARVVTRLYEGAFEVVEAFVPGEEAEEIVLVAHLCHPRPSANDNASGSAALLEAVVVLQRLLTSGEMPRLRRGVRFLWVPEFTGTYAYLATREEAIERMVAGLNLDMVGESQEQCGCVFLIERPSDSMASFAPELLERLREELSSGGVSHTGVGIGGFPTYRQAVAPFSGGSDHALLSDPTVGVPTPMLIQWPDRYWHTTLDTPDRVDPEMLARAGPRGPRDAGPGGRPGRGLWLLPWLRRAGGGAVAGLPDDGPLPDPPDARGAGDADRWIHSGRCGVAGGALADGQASAGVPGGPAGRRPDDVAASGCVPGGCGSSLAGRGGFLVSGREGPGREGPCPTGGKCGSGGASRAARTRTGPVGAGSSASHPPPSLSRARGETVPATASPGGGAAIAGSAVGVSKRACMDVVPPSPGPVLGRRGTDAPGGGRPGGDGGGSAGRRTLGAVLPHPGEGRPGGVAPGLEESHEQFVPLVHS